LWRIFAISFISKKQIPICLIAQGEDAYFLKKDLEQNLRGFEIVYFIDIAKQNDIQLAIDQIKEKDIEYIVVDTKDDAIGPYLSELYNLMFSGAQFFEVSDLYETLYGRVPLGLVKHGWFLEHVKSKPHVLYDFFKRIMDVSAALVLFIPSLCIYPIIFVLIKLEDKGPLLYRDIRVGKDNKIITVLKFRSMTVGIIPEFGRKVETKLGKFMRKTRIDELPQLINVLRGDLSLIGPRPEQPKLFEEYMQNVPYYNVRHLIKPGLSGWAQIYHENHPHHGIDIEATKEKLSFDLFYIKNRSVILDLIICLKTVKTLVLSKGK
jgi:lipopolysaccharide/colanic/teichoic acid biosynthesis glycosyltransferase